LSITGILGIDSMLSQLSLGLEWEVSPGTSIGLRGDLCHAFLDPADQPTELLVIPFGNRLTLSFSTSY
jgi:hypothetical protein